ncbi:hypothetical protein NC652_022072 [Populus alba x Populus x berolinensis]|nr:hypothetical protein NC652_022072 [Populus alba x Populus x berolinensis]
MICVVFFFPTLLMIKLYDYVWIIEQKKGITCLKWCYIKDMYCVE